MMMKIINVSRRLGLAPSRKILCASLYIQKSDDTIFHTVQHNAVEKTPITAQLWQTRYGAAPSPDANRLPDYNKYLILKNVSDSRQSLQYNFKSDPNLRDLYVDHRGNVLIGKLLEDLDALAGSIAFSHCGHPESTAASRLSLVTASVDKIIQSKSISVDRDIMVVGQVAYIGKSSLDIVIEVHNNENLGGVEPPMITSTDSMLLSSIFTFAARHKDSGKAAVINKISFNRKEEEDLADSRSTIAVNRKQQKNLDFERNQQCGNVMRQLIEAGSVLEDMPALSHPNAVLMKLTGLENSFICQPQNVNLAGRVFGGFIMHRAYDLALATCYTFAGSYPVFQQVDKIVFRKPVDIGDLVRLKSRVVFTYNGPIRSTVHVEVYCQVVRPERASSFISNTFHFVYGFNDNVAVRKVLPLTTEEAAILVSSSSSYHNSWSSE